MKPSNVVSIGIQAVLLLKDGFSGVPIDDARVTFKVGQRHYEPLRNSDGFYVFTDCPGPTPHRLVVSCVGFADAEVTLTAASVPLLTPLVELIVVLELEPSALYSYPTDTTIVCGQVTSSGESLPDVEVFALFADPLGIWQWRKTRTYGSESDADIYVGRYTLALPPAAANTEVHLRFAKDGHALHFDRVAPTRSMTTIVGADLQPANA